VSKAIANPFPDGDPDRHSIWEMLVERDIAAFLAADWSMVEPDFAAEQFAGYAGPSNPDHWRIDYPTLASYRDEWLRQAAAFQGIQLRATTPGEFLHRTTVLRDIEIKGDLAMVHKKFEGSATTVGGESLTLNWQSIYWLRRFSSGWKITGFLGYLPNPMPSVPGQAAAFGIALPAGASQHVTAGPYSPALRVTAPTLVAISGQGPIDLEGHIVGTTIEEQAEVTLANCVKQLESAGVALKDVFKVMVYLGDMSEWDAFNQVYRQYFTPPYPVRTAIQAVLWGGMKIEIDMMAVARR